MISSGFWGGRMSMYHSWSFTKLLLAVILVVYTFRECQPCSLPPTFFWETTGRRISIGELVHLWPGHELKVTTGQVEIIQPGDCEEFFFQPSKKMWKNWIGTRDVGGRSHWCDLMSSDSDILGYVESCLNDFGISTAEVDEIWFSAHDDDKMKLHNVCFINFRFHGNRRIHQNHRLSRGTENLRWQHPPAGSLCWEYLKIKP